jgi:hypothetical protein
MGRPARSAAKKGRAACKRVRFSHFVFSGCLRPVSAGNDCVWTFFFRLFMLLYLHLSRITTDYVLSPVVFAVRDQLLPGHDESDGIAEEGVSGKHTVRVCF